MRQGGFMPDPADPIAKDVDWHHRLQTAARQGGALYMGGYGHYEHAVRYHAVTNARFSALLDPGRLVVAHGSEADWLWALWTGAIERRR